MREVFKRYEIGFDILLVTLVGALAYFPLLPGLGYYRDDWHIVFGGLVFGPGIFRSMFSIDRPLVGLIYDILYRILGVHILNWQLAAFGVRLAGVLAVFWIMLMLWPRQRLAATVMGVLAIIYPGFLQQSNAMTYINHEIAVTSVVLSIALTVAACKSSRWTRVGLTVLSMLLLLVFLGSYEPMIGLEGMRLAILYYLETRRPGRWHRRLLAVLKNYAPYLATMLLFIVWRTVIFQSGRPGVDVSALVQTYRAAPIYQLSRVFAASLQDAFIVLFGAWFIAPYTVFTQLRLMDFLAALILGAATFVPVYALVRWSEHTPKDEADDSDPGWTRAAMLIGATSMVAAILPVVVAGREVNFVSILTTAFDHFSLHSSVGAVLLLTGALFHPSVSHRVRMSLLGLAVVVGILTQYGAGVIFRDSWSYTRQFWWQLSWRAPGLEPGTNLIAGFPQNVNVAVESYQVAYPADLIYFPVSQDVQISADLLNSATVEKVILGVSESSQQRTIPFSRDFRNTLLAVFPSASSCLHVVDGAHDLIPPGTDAKAQLIFPYSNIRQITTGGPAQTPPAAIFGASPGNTWCYYYQRASLAVQQEDWAAVARLGDEAQALGLSPYDLSEWWPFILGYANQNQPDSAGQLIRRLKDVAYLRYQVCNTGRGFPPGMTDAGRQVIVDRLCNNP